MLSSSYEDNHKNDRPNDRFGFNVAANYRMLYIIDSNITQEAKEKGIQLMTQYLGQVFPIMDYEP